MSDVPHCSLHAIHEEIQNTCQDELAWSPLGLREHLYAHLQQSQQIGAIKYLVDPHCKEEQDLCQSEEALICCDTQQESNVAAPREMKSKRDILREKRDKKKQQAQERQNFAEEVISKTERKEYENMTKEERAERQREKNRESAQLSRDRKKMKEDIMQKDLQFLTEENKQLQALLKKQIRCVKCGTLNKSQHDTLAETNNSSSENSNAPLIEYNYKINTARDYHSSCDSDDLPLTAEPLSSPLCEKSAGPASIYEFFDFQKAPHWSNCLNVSGQHHNISHSGFTKGGAWSTTFVIFLLYMMILFPGPQQQNQENWGALEASLRQIQMIGPYSQIVEECRSLSQEQIFQKLLMSLNSLEVEEREEFHNSQAFQDETEANEKIYGETRIQQQQQQRQKFWEFYKDYQDAEMKKEIENKHYYSEVSQKLEELQKEKLEQLEALKKLFNQTSQQQLPETPCLSLEETRSQPGQQEQDCSYAFSQAQEFAKHNHIVDPPSHLSENLIKNKWEDQVDYHALKEYDEFSSSQDSMMDIPPPDHPFIIEGQDKQGINYYEYLRREEALKQHNFYELQQPQQHAYQHQVRHAVRPYAY